MSKFWIGLSAAAGMVVVLMSAQQAWAAPCLANPTCTLDGQTFTTTGGTSGDGLSFLASFTTPNPNNSSIATLVDDYLKLLGFKNVTYLGRQDGSGTIDGDSITVSGAQSGTWTLNPGTTGDVGAFIAIHAGNGQDDELFEINSRGTSGTWGTENGKDLSNFDLFRHAECLGYTGAGIPCAPRHELTRLSHHAASQETKLTSTHIGCLYRSPLPGFGSAASGGVAISAASQSRSDTLAFIA